MNRNYSKGLTPRAKKRRRQIKIIVERHKHPDLVFTTLAMYAAKHRMHQGMIDFIAKDLRTHGETGHACREGIFILTKR